MELPGFPAADSIGDWLDRVGETLTALVAAGIVLGFLWTRYRASFGRRRDRYRRLKRLGTNAQVSFFSSVLGEPPALRRTQVGAVTRFDEAENPYQEQRVWTECVWVDPRLLRPRGVGSGRHRTRVFRNDPEQAFSSFVQAAGWILYRTGSSGTSVAPLAGQTPPEDPAREDPVSRIRCA